VRARGSFELHVHTSSGMCPGRRPVGEQQAHGRRGEEKQQRQQTAQPRGDGAPGSAPASSSRSRPEGATPEADRAGCLLWPCLHDILTHIHSWRRGGAAAVGEGVAVASLLVVISSPCMVNGSPAYREYAVRMHEPLSEGCLPLNPELTLRQDH
jgi:hypothetical protein